MPPQSKSLSYTSEVVVDQVDEGGMGGVDQQGDDEVDMVELGKGKEDTNGTRNTRHDTFALTIKLVR